MSKPKVPPKKNPLGRGIISGFTLVRVGSKEHGVLRGTDEATGRTLWEYLLRARGGKPCKNLYCKDWDDALSEARKQVAEWGKAKVAAPPGAWTVSMLIARYFEAKADRDSGASPGTIRVERAWIKRSFEPYFVTELKDPPVDKITDAHVLAWKAKYVDGDGRSDSTRHHRVRVASALFRFAVRKGFLTANPVEDFAVRPKLVKAGGDQRGHYPLAAAEFDVMREWLDEHAPPSVAFATRLAAAVGLRDQELTHLRLGDLRLDAVTPLVHVAHYDCACGYCAKNRGGKRRTKTKIERLVPLPPELVADFRAYLAARAEQVPPASPWAFPVWSAIRSGARKPGDQLGEGTLNDWLQKAVEAAEIAVNRERERLVFHSMRSHAETQLALRSRDFVAVSVCLGHALPGMGSRYNTLAERPAELAAALYPPKDGASKKGGLAIVA